MTAILDAILAQASRDPVPDGVLLMRLLSEAAAEDDARQALTRALASAGPDARARLDRVRALWAAQPQSWSVVRSVHEGVSHDPRDVPSEEALRSWADAFDRLASAAPEAGVALYCLGSPALLAAATQEIVALMDGFGLLGPDRDALDLGCGIGRLVVALAPRLRSVLGTDISAGMVAETRQRCASLANVRLLQCGGRDLGFAADASLDVVLAADVFPYLVQAGSGLAARHVAEFARVLRPGGAALILNYSYRGDIEADRSEVAALAKGAGLAVERSETRDLESWDASTFLLRKDPTARQ